MAQYVDGFVLPLPKKNVAKYRRLARLAARVWREHGALEYRECVGDDLRQAGGIVAFPRLARARAGETVIFAWITHRSKAHRDRANARVMKDPRILAMLAKDTPFDVKRMAYGGFRVLVAG